jgi:hypothetical protein
VYLDFVRRLNGDFPRGAQPEARVDRYQRSPDA